MEILWEMQQPKGCKVRIDIHELHVSAHITGRDPDVIFGSKSTQSVALKWRNFDQQSEIHRHGYHVLMYDVKCIIDVW